MSRGFNKLVGVKVMDVDSSCANEIRILGADNCVYEITAEVGRNGVPAMRLKKTSSVYLAPLTLAEQVADAQKNVKTRLDAGHPPVQLDGSPLTYSEKNIVDRPIGPQAVPSNPIYRLKSKKT